MDNLIEILTIYGSGCIVVSGYLMITIYEPVIEEIKYIVTERYGEEALKYTHRFNMWYAFTAFLLAVVFAPYLAYKVGRYDFMKAYKDELWLEIHGEVREGIRENAVSEDSED